LGHRAGSAFEPVHYRLHILVGLGLVLRQQFLAETADLFGEKLLGFRQGFGGFLVESRLFSLFEQTNLPRFIVLDERYAIGCGRNKGSEALRQEGEVGRPQADDFR